MKRRLVSILVFGALTVHASEGGVSGGGGNALRGTPQQVADYVRLNLNAELDGRLRAIRLGLSPNSPIPIQTPSARKILSDIMNLKQVVNCEMTEASTDCTSTLNPSRHPELLELKMSGACVENGQARDASVTFHRNSDNEPVLDSICLSAERLAVYPYSTLGNQISALIIHEFSHIAGYQEPDAVNVQTYAAEKLLDECTVSINLKTDDPSDYDAYSVNFKGQYWPVTRHLRWFQGEAGNTIELRTNDQGSPLFFLRFIDPAQGGEMQFLSLNSNGRISTNWISWGPMESYSNADRYGARSYTTRSGVESRMEFDGKTMIADQVQTSAGCLR